MSACRGGGTAKAGTIDTNPGCGWRRIHDLIFVIPPFRRTLLLHNPTAGLFVAGSDSTADASLIHRP